MTANFQLYQQGPDNRSTYSECAGLNPSSRGRLLAESDTLAELLADVVRLEHDNFRVYGPDGYICGNKSEFFAMVEGAAYYVLYQCGPDNHSTYPECWGSTATSRGRVIAESDTLAGLADAVRQLGHDNFAIYGPEGHICGRQSEYFALIGE